LQSLVQTNVAGSVSGVALATIACQAA
jgi:hypothetical protein